MKYLIIDGNNLAIRHAFANKDLESHLGIPTACHFGVFNSLIGLKNRFGDYQFLIVWDGKSKRRMQESEDAVKRGLIPSAYKANRDYPQPILDFHKQSPYLKRGIGQTGIPQIRLADYEADDVIASYCKLLRDDHEVVVVTSDHDYYQALHENVSLWDGMKMEGTTLAQWKERTGLEPHQHIDCGALSGDTSDNIFGIPGWGEKTATKSIVQSGTWQEVIKRLSAIYCDARDDYPDVYGDDFKELEAVKTPKGNQKYPDIKGGMPFSGVALAFEKGQWKPKSKSGLKANLMALMFQERIELAYSLKSMDDDIDGLPEIVGTEPNRERILEYFDFYAIESLKDEVGILV